MTRRRDVLETGFGAALAGLTGSGVSARDEPTAADGETMELLAEGFVDHSHACSHAKFDDRVPLDAGESVDDPPVVDETHTVWEVSHGDPGYVAFDPEGPVEPPPFVFYTVDGTVRPLVGETVERAPVSDDDCEELDEYTMVDPVDGELMLAVGARSVSLYADGDGVVHEVGVEAAFADWRLGLLGTDVLRAVAEAYWLDSAETARASTPSR